MRVSSNVLVIVAGLLLLAIVYGSSVALTESPVPGVEIVGYDIPQIMNGGTSYPVHVTVRNAGDMPWNNTNGVSLGCVGYGPADGPDRFGVTRMSLPAGISVQPGETYDFNFTMVAPYYEGTLLQQYRMVWTNHTWFGGYVNASILVKSVDAEIVSDTIPSEMTPGQTYPVSITIRNTGTMPWTSTQNLGVGWPGYNYTTPTQFGAGRQFVPSGTEVQPGQAYTWSFDLTAPDTPGIYNASYQPVWTNISWFGPLAIRQVNVSCAPDAVIVSQDIPSTMQGGSTYTVHVTVRNTGDIAWDNSKGIAMGCVGYGPGAALDQFGVTRLFIEPGTTVQPGETCEFVFNMTAPYYQGNLTAQYRMVWTNYTWFGEYLNATVSVSSTDSVIVSDTIPETMFPGRTYSASVTVMNSGPMPWNSTYPIALGWSGYNYTTPNKFGVIRQFVPAGALILPGETYIWSFNMTAPSNPGIYNASYQMVWTNVSWFGPLAAKQVNVTCAPNATMVSSDVPAEMLGGQTYPVRVAVLNTGDVAWDGTNGVALGCVGYGPGAAADRFDVTRIFLQPDVIVQPGETCEFVFNMTAPYYQGNLTAQYRMVWTNYTWFGEYLNSTVRVYSTDAAILSDTIPGDMISGQTYPVSITVQNTGRMPWNGTQNLGIGWPGYNYTTPNQFGVYRQFVPADMEVLPGENQTWSFNLTAPASPGKYGLSCQMVWTNVSWFGPVARKQINVTAGIPLYNATIVNHTIPSAMVQGRNVTVTVLMNNTGVSNWTLSSAGTSGVYLAAIGNNSSDSARFGHARIDLLNNTSVLSGQEYAFTFVMNAPNETGRYYPAYQLYSDEYGPFGPVVNVSVNVTDGSSAIQFLAPLDDSYANETISFTGSVKDSAITNLTLTHNGVDLGLVPVLGGNFTATVNLTAINNVTVSAIDSQGLTQSATLLLDGDLLPGDYELAVGFDPLNPDSDNLQTSANESGIGILDGHKCLNGDQLPAVAKYLYGLDLFKIDTDGDVLSDYFEVMKLGLATDPLKNDTDNNSVSDALEDADGDGLSNLEEQTYGSHPLVQDTDGDGLADKQEIIFGSDPTKADSDNDDLTDDSELKLGTFPLNPDSNGNGILDGNETYTVTITDSVTGVSVALTGKGDMSKKLKILNETSEAFQNNPARVGSVAKFDLTGSYNSAVVSVPYDPAKVTNPANLTLAYYNRTYGTYIPVSTTIYTASHMATGQVPYLTDVTVLDRQVVQNVTASSAIVADPRVGYVMHLTTTELQQYTTYYYYGGGNFAAGHYQIEAQGSYNDYTGVAIPVSAITNYNFGAGIHVVYGSMNRPISQMVTSGNVVEFDHSGGKIGIYNQIPYSPSYCSGDLYYTLYYMNRTDTDGDGLYDYIETMGYYDGNYNYYQTDLNNPDTDGDGIPDGVEVDLSNFWIANGFRYYHFYSNPTKNDTDSDNLNDFQELCELGTDPYNKDTDNDAWTDGDEVHAVNWPVATDPLNPDTDGDGVIDSIDPDPMDKTNCTLPAEWHAGEFVQGLLLGDVASSDPRHQNGAFETGQFISQLVCVGNARDLITQAGQGKKGPELLFLAVGCIPGEGTLGTLGKGSLKAAKWVSKLDDVAKQTRYTSDFLQDAKLLGKNVDSTEFTRVAWGDNARALEQGGVTPETLGKMGENGFDPQTGKKVLDTLNAKGTDLSLTNRVLQSGSGTAADEIVSKMDPADRLVGVSNIVDGTTYSMDRTVLETGRTMKVDVKVVGNKETYIDDVVNRAGVFEYNQLLLKTMQDNQVSEDIARIMLDNEGNSLLAITSKMKNNVMADTGTLGEKVALNELLQRSDLVVLGHADGFLKTGSNQHGFDYICMDAQGNYVIVEVKGTVKKEKFSKSLLSVDSNGYRQMSDDWVTSRITSMKCDIQADMRHFCLR